MNIEHLFWDSQFFGLRIGKAVIQSADDALFLHHNQSLKNDFDLIYIFSNPDIQINSSTATLMDKKTIFEKKINCQNNNCAYIQEYTESSIHPDLYRLTLQSGEFSRFKIDSHFPVGSFERLYKRWIEQSVHGSMADTTLCYIQDNTMLGMITIKCNHSFGTIGLVSVEKSARKRGIGSKLLSAAENYCFKHQIYNITVATQLDNKVACDWYAQNGYKITSVTHIYHQWL